jgi:hypothetical protein
MHDHSIQLDAVIVCTYSTPFIDHAAWCAESCSSFAVVALQGGGIVKGPLMLELGVCPEVSAATSATMIMFTAGSVSDVCIRACIAVTHGVSACFTDTMICTFASLSSECAGTPLLPTCRL